MTDTVRRPKELRRSRADRMVAGVCGGLGRYFGVDATIVRIVFSALVLAAGAGLVLYLIAWTIMREEEPGAEEPAASSPWTMYVVIGGGLVVFGMLFLVRQITGVWWVQPRFAIPVACMAVGFAILAKGRRK